VLVDSWLHNDLQVALIGPKLDLTYDYEVSACRVWLVCCFNEELACFIFWQCWIFMPFPMISCWRHSVE